MKTTFREVFRVLRKSFAVQKPAKAQSNGNARHYRHHQWPDDRPVAHRRHRAAHAKCYEVRYATVVGQTIGAWVSGGMFTNSRSMALDGLAAGTNYIIEVRGIGGSTKYSELCAPPDT